MLQTLLILLYFPKEYYRIKYKSELQQMFTYADTFQLTMKAEA